MTCDIGFKLIPTPAQRLRDELQRIVDDSVYAAAARAVGFTFGPVSVTERAIRMEFNCLCGQHEVFQYEIPGLVSEGRGAFHRMPDMAEMLYRHGSFSESHLLRDGYEPAFAKAAARKFDVVLNALIWDRQRQVADARGDAIMSQNPLYCATCGARR